MNFCSECGSAVSLRFLPDEGKERYVCDNCGMVHYQNPKILVGCIVNHGDSILLMKRANSPGKDKWCAPSGFMESEETLEEAAVRETFEETGVSIPPEDVDLHTITSLKDISEVYVVFRAEVQSRDIEIGEEALDAAWFTKEQLPWDDLAFVESYGFFRLFFRELERGEYSVHVSRADGLGKYRVSYPTSPPQCAGSGGV